MLTEVIMGIVFVGHLSAAAALPFLASRAWVAEAFRASFDRSATSVGTAP
jgi:hypothetical protein